MPKSVYRVNYHKAGTPATAFVVAENESQAGEFLGVRDGSAAVSAVASPVEVVGVDKAHAALTPAPIFKAPPQAPKQLNDEEIAELRELLAKHK